MNEIRCPNCGKVFQVDEAGYAAIVSQVHNEQFEKELADRSAALRREMEASGKNALTELAMKHERELAAKDQEILRLREGAKSAGTEKERDVRCSLLNDTSEVIERTYAGETYYIKRTRTGFNQFIPISLKFRMVDTIGGYSLKLSNILGDWWDGFYLDMGNVDHEGEVYFKNSKKPERLLFRILNMFTQPGEYVLDPFLGSGTTAAAAHKMRRRWIGIESGEHACTLCKPRLDRIIDGTDSTGITRFTDWQGGSGYRFCEVSSGG